MQAVGDKDCTIIVKNGKSSRTYPCNQNNRKRVSLSLIEIYTLSLVVKSLSV